MIDVAPGSTSDSRAFFFVAALAEFAWLGFLAWLVWVG